MQPRHPPKKKHPDSAYLIYSTSYQTNLSFETINSSHSEHEKIIPFRTHTSTYAEKLHQVSEFIMLPLRWSGQMLARLIEPNPGENKGSRLRSLAIRLMAVIGFILLLPLALVSFIVGFPLRMVDHLFRPSISHLRDGNAKPDKKPALTKQKPLHIRTHNLGFVLSTVGIVSDLRDATIRAKELTLKINKDSKSPDIICFQEAFHEDAVRILCEGIQVQYPYIIHSVAPQISGFSSGAMIASKYPLLSVDFERFTCMVGPEKLSPRGIFKVSLATERGEFVLYNIHTQALPGEKRAQARLMQLTRVHQMMAEDLSQNSDIHQVLVGDLNASRVAAWGEESFYPLHQAEEAVLNFIESSFHDPFLIDHDVTAKRTRDNPVFLATDQEDQQAMTLSEPSGTFYSGPMFHCASFFEAQLNQYEQESLLPKPEKDVRRKISEESSWGTKEWQKQQIANTARFDYILFPKKSKLQAQVEIRNIGGNEFSASTDHLPVDALVWTP